MSLKNSKIVIGRGEKKFLPDDWCRNRTPWDLFPSLFLIYTNPDSRIEEKWSPQGWNLVFRRILNDWDIDIVVGLLSLTGGFRVLS